MKVLIDENLSPTLVHRLAAMGIAAEHVAHVGRGGETDPELWSYAFRHDQVVVTINAADFLHLAGASEVHAGLVVLRARGLDAEEQWKWIEPVFREDRDLLNEVVEVTGPGEFTIRALPRR